MADLDIPIRSRSNPLFQRFRALKDRGAADLCLLEGPKLLEEALLSGIALVEVVAAPPTETGERGNRLLASLRERGTAVRRMDADLVAALSEAETSQGVLALARRPAFDEDALFRGAPLIVVAVGVQDPGNLGGLLRTADAAGATGAYLTCPCWRRPRTATPSTIAPISGGRSPSCSAERERDCRTSWSAAPTSGCPSPCTAASRA